MYNKISRIKGITSEELQVMTTVNLIYLLSNDPKLKQYTAILSQKKKDEGIKTC